MRCLAFLIYNRDKKRLIEGKCVFCETQEKDITLALFYNPSIRNWWSIFKPEVDNLMHPFSFYELAQEVLTRSKGKN